MPHQLSPTLSERLQHLPAEDGALSFIQNLEKYEHERPYRWAAPLEKSQEHLRTNIQLESRRNIVFRDIRQTIGSEQTLSLKQDGFQILRYCSDTQDPQIGDQDALRTYLNGLASSIKELLSAELVYCVNFVFRQCKQSDLLDPDETFVKSATPTSVVKPDVPAFPAHADFTRSYGGDVIQQSLTEEETTQYLNDNYRVWLINAWKPLFRPVQNAPLAFCDPSTVSPADICEVDIASPTRVSGATYLKYNPKQQWYWCSNQTPNEVSLFKSWDTDEHTTIPYVPHCAVRLAKFATDNHITGTQMDAVLRDSIEARMVVVMKKDC